jgi:hypothetical protein
MATSSERPVIVARSQTIPWTTKLIPTVEHDKPNIEPDTKILERINKAYQLQPA